MHDADRERIPSLPKWAQNVIYHLEKERDDAMKAKADFIDEQTPSPFYVDEYDWRESTHYHRRRYIQTHNALNVLHGEVHLRIIIREDTREQPCIELQYGHGERGSIDEVVLQPYSTNAVRLFIPDPRKRDRTWCQALHQTVDTDLLERVTKKFNELRDD